MRTLWIAVAATAFVGMAMMASSRPIQTASSAPSRPPRLFKDSRQQLAIARAQGRREITLVVATVVGQTEAAVREATRLGGNIRFRDDDAGYIRVRLPLDKVTEFSASGGVESAAADQDGSFPSRLSGESALLQAKEPWPPLPGDYPLRHQYSVLQDLNATDFVARKFDGRGVTIAILDGNIDPFIPEFQTAYALDGARLPKFADYLNVSDPRDDADLTPQWVNMQTEVDGSTGKVTWQDKTFNLPKPGPFRIGFFDERRFNDPANLAYIDQDVDRDGNPKGDDGLFGVLWDERTNDVWVDTNRNLDFADEKAMTDYIKRPEFGTFGKDNPATPIRESIGFAVQTDSLNKFVSINIGVYQHASEIMGSVVGKAEPNGRIQGVAPGARLVSMFYGVGITHGAIEGLIRAFRHPLIDVIVFEQSVNMASVPYLLADAHHPISVIAQRLTEKYQKLMFVPCGNAPGFALASEDGVAPGVVCVGGYQNSGSYLANTGWSLEDSDNLHWGALSHGPAGNGALKPDLLAPSGQLGTDVAYRKGGAGRGLYQFPPGYSMTGGTSTATPTAAGAAALVLSAARQRGVKYDAVKLKAALQGSGRFIPGHSASEQGAGLIQVPAAFDLLEKLQSVQMIKVESRAPVKTAISSLMVTPNEGPGLYEREGWKSGDRGERMITLIRRSGPADPITATLKWTGNDGTFSAPASVVLPLNRAVQVPITIAVASAGAHSAILSVEHSSMPVPLHRVLCAVIAALQFTSQEKFAASTTVAVPKAADRSVFLQVPPGAAALSASASSSDGPVRMNVISPDRDYMYACVFPATSAPCVVGKPWPGVWEINMSNSDMAFDENASQPAKPKSVKFTATLLGIDVEASPPAAALNRADGSASFPVRLANRLGNISAASVASTALGSAAQASRTIAQGEHHMYSIDVPKGSTSVLVRVRAANARADLDIYLLDCTGLKREPGAASYDRKNGGKSPTMLPIPCSTRAKSSNVDANGEIEVVDPAPGLWVVVVDAFSAPAGGVAYTYLDAFTHPRFGTIAVTDMAENRDAGSSWNESAHAWTSALPDSPRSLFGRLIVTSRDAVQSGLSQRSWPVTVGSTDIFAPK